MKKFTPLFIFTALLFFGTLANAQTITNGDFENWAPSCPVNTAPNNWTNFSNSLGPDQAGTCAGVVVSYQGSSHMNLVWANYPLMEGAKQAMSGLTIGSVYQVSFYAIQDQGLYASNGSVYLDFYHNSTVVFSTPELFTGGPWTLYNANFTALTATDTIGFQIRAGSTGTSGSVGVDHVFIAEVTGVNENLSSLDFSVYPNPSNGVFMILTSETEKVQVEVLNLIGEEVYSSLITNNSTTIDLSETPKGIYFVKITSGNKSSVKKLVIE